MQPALSDARHVFDANRARGRVTLGVVAPEGVTRCKTLHESGPLRIRFPNAEPGALEAVIVNTAGGIAGGDALVTGISLAEGSALLVNSAAAEKVYRSTGPDAQLSLTLEVGAGAHLSWLPQETILFDGARMARRIEVDLAEDASLVMAEMLVFGRSAMGEVLKEGAVADRWRVRRAGRLVFAETTRLMAPIAGKLAQPAVANGCYAVATVLIAPCDELRLAVIREQCPAFAGEGGISAWNGIAVARLCAPDGATLRRDMIGLLAALEVRLPRLWLQ